MASPAALDFLLTRRSRPAKLLSAPGPGRDEVLRLALQGPVSPLAKSGKFEEAPSEPPVGPDSLAH